MRKKRTGGWHTRCFNARLKRQTRMFAIAQLLQFQRHIATIQAFQQLAATKTVLITRPERKTAVKIEKRSWRRVASEICRHLYAFRISCGILRITTIITSNIENNEQHSRLEFKLISEINFIILVLLARS